MKHKNAEMIIAKANNTELVVLVKVIDSQNESGSYWTNSSLSTLSVAENKFFLCLPQHKQACLHWLNGGCVQTRRECSDLDWDSLLPFDGEWVKVSHFMCVDNLLRIKPKKERRWIAYCASRNQTIPHPQDSKQLAMDYTALHYSYHIDEWQFIEVEFEV